MWRGSSGCEPSAPPAGQLEGQGLDDAHRLQPPLVVVLEEVVRHRHPQTATTTTTTTQAWGGSRAGARAPPGVAAAVVAAVAGVAAGRVCGLLVATHELGGDGALALARACHERGLEGDCKIKILGTGYKRGEV